MADYGVGSSATNRRRQSGALARVRRPTWWAVDPAARAAASDCMLLILALTLAALLAGCGSSSYPPSIRALVLRR
jgi:hypothetical protein